MVWKNEGGGWIGRRRLGWVKTMSTHTVYIRMLPVNTIHNLPRMV